MALGRRSGAATPAQDHPVIKGKIDGADKLVGDVQRVTARVFSEVKRILRTEAVLMGSHIKANLMSGPRPGKLGVRSGALRASVKSLQVVESPGLLESGVGFGTAYARPHVGPKGQVTTIKPVNAKYLTIPLPAAMTRAGVPRGSARNGPWGETFFLRSRKRPGELILFGKMSYTKGKKAGQLKQGMRLAGGGIVPLFLLVKQVKIKSRIHPEEILAWEKPKMIAAFRNIGVNLRGA
jgi:hypothetical protein